MTPSFASQRVVLFLQGPPSPFWYELADAMEAAGARVLRVNLSTADWVFWRRAGAINYRGTRKNWPKFLSDLVRREGVSDILYFSDRFHYHAAAREVAEAAGIKAYAVEFGYLRPGWLTLERGGMSAWSHFPDNPQHVRTVADSCGIQSLNGFSAHKTSTELTFEIIFHLLNEYWRVFFPFYRTGRIHFTTIEYLYGLIHKFKLHLAAPDTEKRLEEDYYSGLKRFFLVPLQLQTDYQIRENTSYRDQRRFLREIVSSFARNAPADRHLLIKLHPLDPGIINWKKEICRLSEEFGLAGRTFTFAGGDLNRLLDLAGGVIVSNSTVGLTSIAALRPTLALGDAVYGMPGLTHQGTLDSFWTNADPVDPALRDAFLHALAGTIQVKGSVYDPPGRAEACEAIVERIMNNTVNGHTAFVTPPPRLVRRRIPF